MAQNDFVPVSWNGESISTDKLNQMANNDQFLFDRTPLVRYAFQGGQQTITRDNSVKIISGKTPFVPSANTDWIRQNIYFGTFFSAGCSPVVTATVETQGPERRTVSIHGLGGLNTDIDINGFVAHVWVASDTGNPYVSTSGFIHWIAVGY